MRGLVPLPTAAASCGASTVLDQCRDQAAEHQQAGPRPKKFRACRGPAPPQRFVAPALRPASGVGGFGCRCKSARRSSSETWLKRWLRRRSSSSSGVSSRAFRKRWPSRVASATAHQGAAGAGPAKQTRAYPGKAARCWPAKSVLSNRSGGEQDPSAAPRGAPEAQQPPATATFAAFAGRQGETEAAHAERPKQRLAWQLRTRDRAGLSQRAQGAIATTDQQENGIASTSKAWNRAPVVPDAADRISCRPAAGTRRESPRKSGRVLLRSRCGLRPFQQQARPESCSRNQGIGPAPDQLALASMPTLAITRKKSGRPGPRARPLLQQWVVGIDKKRCDRMLGELGFRGPASRKSTRKPFGHRVWWARKPEGGSAAVAVHETAKWPLWRHWRWQQG